MKGHAGRPSKESPNNIKGISASAGTGKAYTVSRLQREAPELFAQVAAGTISANAAAIKAGFRNKPTPLEMLIKVWKVATDDDRRLFLLEINP